MGSNSQSKDSRPAGILKRRMLVVIKQILSILSKEKRSLAKEIKQLSGGTN